MTTVLFTLGIFVVFFVLMGIGLIIKGKVIDGTCASKSPALADELGRCPACGNTGECKSGRK